MRNGIVTSFKALPTKYLITKGNTKFIVKKFYKLHLNLVIKMSFFSCRINQICVPSSDKTQQEYSIISGIFLPKLHNLKNQTNLH